MKHPSVFTLTCTVTVVLFCGLLFTSALSSPPVQAAGNCQFTPPLNGMPWKYEKKYRAANPKDCWEIPDGICRKDACAGAGGDAQSLQQFSQLAKQLMDKMMQGGGGSGGGSGGAGSGAVEDYLQGDRSNLDYTQQQALDDLYSDFTTTGSDDIFDYFTPAESTTTDGTGTSDGDSGGSDDTTDDQYGKPGAMPQEYFCEGGVCDSDDERTNDEQEDAGDAQSADQDDDNDDFTDDRSRSNRTSTSGSGPEEVTATNNGTGQNTRGSGGAVSGSGSGGAVSGSGSGGGGFVSTIADAVDRGVEYLQPGERDRIIYDDEETQNIDLTDPRRANSQSARQGTPSGPTSGSGVPNDPPPPTDTDALTQQFNWQQVQNDDSFTRLLFQLGLLQEVDGQIEPSYLSWFLVTPSHGLGAGVSGSIRAALSDT